MFERFHIVVKVDFVQHALLEESEEWSRTLTEDLIHSNHRLGLLNMMGKR